MGLFVKAAAEALRQDQREKDFRQANRARARRIKAMTEELMQRAPKGRNPKDAHIVVTEEELLRIWNAADTLAWEI